MIEGQGQCHYWRVEVAVGTGARMAEGSGVMKRNLRPRVLMAAAISCGLGATAEGEETRTAGELADYCRAERYSEESVLCGGLVEGTAQMLVWNCVTWDYGWRPDPTVVAGPPPSLEAAVEAFLGWVRDDPRRAEEEWHLGLTSALTDAFPCER